uniref:Uncharacterized protein n=1 Tax=Arundo donax TaxID=35708 RepID=A0A0A9F197_ARUDO
MTVTVIWSSLFNWVNSWRNLETSLPLKTGISTTVHWCPLISLMIPSARDSVS